MPTEVRGRPLELELLAAVLLGFKLRSSARAEPSLQLSWLLFPLHCILSLLLVLLCCIYKVSFGTQVSGFDGGTGSIGSLESGTYLEFPLIHLGLQEARSAE